MKTSIKFFLILALFATFLSLGSCKKNGNNTQSSNQQTENGGNQSTDAPAPHVCNFTVESAPQLQSCSTDGITNYVCSCGKSKTEIKKATGHSFGEWETVKADSCAGFGEIKRSCGICHAEERTSTEKLAHSYTAVTSEVDGASITTYTCSGCSDEFTLESDRIENLEAIEPTRLSGCKNDFTFTIIAPDDETYIRENLKITDTYYEGTDKESVIEYELEYQDNNVWLVIPAESYVSGNVYKASRSGEVIFFEYGLQDLTFAIKKETTNVATFNDVVIFLAALEKKSPGYYPYTLEYSENADMYWLTVGKIDNLAVGDIICVGTAENSTQIMASNKENIFGKINLISYSQEEKLYYIALSVPELSEIFDKLDIYSTGLEQNGEIKFTDSEDLSSQVIAALTSSEDYINFMGATYVTATEYLGNRGAQNSIGTFSDFLKSIKFNDEKSEKPTIDEETGVITAKIFIDGKITIPVTVEYYGSSRNVGSVIISISTYVYLDYLQFTVGISDEGGRGENSKTTFSFGVAQSVTIGFTFDVSIDVDYSLEAYPYVLNKQSGSFHFASCIHVASMNEENAEYITATDLLERINKGEVDSDKECGTCRPIRSMESDTYILNTNTKKIHVSDCKHLQSTNYADLLITGSAYGNLELRGYTACESCKPYSRYTNSFSEALAKKVESGDFGHNIEEIKAAADKAATEDTRKKLLIAELPLAYGVFRLDFEIYAYVNFTLEASLSYKFERTDTAEFGVELRGKKLVPYSSRDSITNEHSLEVLGETRLEAGAIGVANGYVIGLEKWLYVRFSAEVGAYALANGVFKCDIVHENETYMAAYFEAGFLLDIYLEAKIPLFNVWKKTFYSGEYPMYKLGYEKVIHKYTSLPEYILLEDTYLDLNRSDLMTVGYFDLLTMTTGVMEMNYLGVTGRYSVEYSFYDGGNCFIEDGILYIIDPSVSFVDALIINVIGYDDWTTFRPGNVKFSLPEIQIPIVYEALDNMLSYDIDFATDSYIVIGIGNYSLGALNIPAEYNGKPVRDIERHAFSGCQTITSVVIPDSVINIYDHAFYCCENLLYIYIGDGVERITQGAFCGCTKAEYIRIGNNVKHIGDWAFDGCASIVSIEIPDSVIELCGTVFSDCFALETVKIGKNVEFFGRHAFSGCGNLTTIYIPKSVTNIEDNVFYCCDNLSTIYYQGSEEDIKEIRIDESNLEYIQKATIYYNFEY